MPKQMGLSRQRQDDQFSAWHRLAHHCELQTEIIDRRHILAKVNGEFIKAADYYFHARELNTAAWSRAIFPEALPSLERFADP
jgi:hypothetical protein